MLSHAIKSSKAFQITDNELDILKGVGSAGVVGVLVRFVWKILNKFTSQADSVTAKNNAEETLWKRLQDQIEELQASEIEMEKKIEMLRTELLEVKQENARLHTENLFHKQKIDEQLEVIATLENMINSVHITDKSNADK